MTLPIGSTGTISSAGVGSGLDVETIVTKLMSIEQRPLTMLQGDASDIQTRISAYGALQSAESAFRDAAVTLASSASWTSTTATSSDPSSLGATAATGAAAGSYSIEVQSLATAQSVASAAYGANTASVGAGTLHLETGAWAGDPPAFTPGAGTTGVDIAVAATDTLATLRDKINAADAGVKASIVTDSTGSRLVMTAAATGAANGFRVTATESADAPGLAALAYDPATAPPATTLTQSGADAAVVVNGLAVRSASNTLANVVEGLTLTLTKVTAGPVQVGVAQDSARTRQAIQGFVGAYNALATLLGKQTQFDAATQSAGTLQGDSTAVSLQRQLRGLLTGPDGASTVFTTLSQVGLEMQRDGTIKVNDTKLTAAMSDIGNLRKLFANADTAGHGANDGIAVRLRKFGDAVLGSGGMLTTRSEGLAKSLALNGKNQAAITQRLAMTEARLRAQYSALDTKMSTLNALSAYMTQQITNWNREKN